MLDSGNPETHNNGAIMAKGGKGALIDAWINRVARTDVTDQVRRLQVQGGGGGRGEGLNVT